MSPTDQANTEDNSAIGATRVRGAARMWLLLGALVIAGAVIRWPALDWGRGLMGDHAPYVQLHPDEPRFVEIARGLHEGSDFRRSYVLGLGNTLRLYLAWHDARGYTLADADLVRFARIMSLMGGLGLVLAVFLFARCVTKDDAVAVVAAGLVAVNTLCVTHSGYGTADMLYTLALYLFAWLAYVAVSQRSLLHGLAGALVVGWAMSLKFGVVLWPSLLLVGWMPPGRRGWRVAAYAVLAAFVFLGTQGFAFNMESLHAIYQGFALENLEGFERSKWGNPVVYGIELLRVVGLPVLAIALWFLCRWKSWASRLREMAIWVALLPVLLHGVGMLFLNTTFPRHLLPLLPLVLMVAAVAACALKAHRLTIAVVLLAWSASLSITDAEAVWRDTRGAAMNWLAGSIPQDTAVWADPYFKLPVEAFFPSAPPSQAEVLVLHEGWTYRFERSELSPWGPPTEEGLYHASPAQLRWHRYMQAEVRQEGTWGVAFRASPPKVLPEQILYARLWGHLNKFAGECVILRRLRP